MKFKHRTINKQQYERIIIHNGKVKLVGHYNEDEIQIIKEIIYIQFGKSEIMDGFIANCPELKKSGYLIEESISPAIFYTSSNNNKWVINNTLFKVITLEFLKKYANHIKEIYGIKIKEQYPVFFNNYEKDFNEFSIKNIIT